MITIHVAIGNREHPAEEFVRWLYREGRLSNNELSGRLRALDAGCPRLRFSTWGFWFSPKVAHY